MRLLKAITLELGKVVKVPRAPLLGRASLAIKY